MESELYPENRPPQSFNAGPLPDLSQYEEVYYEPTPEENETIKKYHSLLKEMGYEEITDASDFDQLFWDLGYKNIVCDKLMRVAIIDNIYYRRLIPKFIGMARRYNGWLNRMRTEKAAVNKKEKEYQKRNAQLEVRRKQLKIEKSVWKLMRRHVKKCDEAIISWYNLTNESGIKEFLKLCTVLDIKVKLGSVKRICYKMNKEGKDPSLFQSMVEEYNRQWSISHNYTVDAPESEENDEDDEESEEESEL